MTRKRLTHSPLRSVLTPKPSLTWTGAPLSPAKTSAVENAKLEDRFECAVRIKLEVETAVSAGAT